MDGMVGREKGKGKGERVCVQTGTITSSKQARRGDEGGELLLLLLSGMAMTNERIRTENKNGKEEQEQNQSLATQAPPIARAGLGFELLCTFASFCCCCFLFFFLLPPKGTGIFGAGLWIFSVAACIDRDIEGIGRDARGYEMRQMRGI
jgi:hypothetical protein